MNALFRMQSEAEPGAVDHFLREWMKQLREVAYDAEDCVDLYLFRIRCRRPGDRFLVRSKRLLVTLLHRRRLAGDIRALRALAVAINEQHARYGVSLDPLRRPPSLAQVSAHAFSPARANDPNHQLVGLNDQVNDLAKMVNEMKTEQDKRLKVFSIVGFGGFGKTTLAMEVGRQLETEFQCQALVSVSQAFDGTKHLNGLLKKALQQIGNPAAGDDPGIKEEANVQGSIDGTEEKLKRTLKNKRYFIVVDDVWTIAAWDAIQSMLPDNNCGSRIIVTTRIDTVAGACNYDSECIYRIRPLSHEDSEKLFLSRAFVYTKKTCPEELEGVKEKVLTKCGGLPLAIISIASILASYTSPGSKHMWETVYKSIGSHMESHPTLEGMRQIVALSYNHLPHHLKACMMYLSIFPEDYVIVKERLLMKWIAEGLVAEKRGLTLMEVAKSYFNELVSISMIDKAADIVNYYDGREETCRVHDMILEVMVNKSLEANFVSLIGGQYAGMSYHSRVRRLSIHGSVERSSSNKTPGGHGRRNGINGMNVQHVRSLSAFELEGHKLLDLLGEFTLLRVLDLEDCKGLQKKHMDCVCRMYLLRFLSLRNTDVRELPKEVGQLENLQTLDVRNTLLQDLPKTVTELENLESLQHYSKDNYWFCHWEAPKGLRKMKALRKLNHVAVNLNNTEAAKEIGELGQLQELTIFVHFSIPQDATKDLSHSLCRLYSLQFLNLEIMCPRGGDEKTNIIHQLHLNSPPRLLRYLRLCGKHGERTLTHWVGLLTNLVEFVVAWAYLHGDTLFNVLCKLPNLERLILETNFYADEEIVAKTTQSFPVLTELVMCTGVEIPTVYRFEEGSMPKLEAIEYDNMGHAHRIHIVGIEHLTKLREVRFPNSKGNRAMEDEVKKLKEENGRRRRNGSNEFKVKVT